MDEITDKILAEIILKRESVRDYWINDVKAYRGTGEYAKIENAVDNFLRGYNEAVDDTIAILEKHGNRPHGRWEERESGFLVCSECADVFILEEWLADGKWEYCPNCGAKMDEENEK